MRESTTHQFLQLLVVGFKIWVCEIDFRVHKKVYPQNLSDSRAMSDCNLVRETRNLVLFHNRNLERDQAKHGVTKPFQPNDVRVMSKA
jgi:hypothetical protein